MKVNNLRVLGQADPPLVLHPQLTVVRGLSPDSRARVISTVGRLVVGNFAVAAGELQASGVIFDLNDEALAILGLEDPAEGVVTAADLPNGEPEPLAPVGPTALDRQLEALELRRSELRQVGEALGPLTSGGVARALAALEEQSVGETRPEAARAADAWRDLHIELKGLEMITSSGERSALSRVVEMEEAVATAEAALRQPLLNPDQIRKVEAAHAAVIEASDRAESRFGGARAKRQLADAEADERHVLERMGFTSWVDYVLTSAQKSGDPTGEADRAGLRAAQDDLADAKAELASNPGATDRVRRRAALRTRADDLAPQVAALLGHQPTGADAEAELRALRTEPDQQAALADLAAELSVAGVAVDPDAQGFDDLVDAAHQVLAVERSADRRRTETTEAMVALDEALAALEEAKAQGASAPPVLALPKLAEPLRSIRELTEGDDEDDHGDGPQVALTAEIDPIARHVLVDEIHWWLLGRLGELRTEGPAGQLPIVLDEPFDTLDDDEVIDVLTRLARFSDLAQIVVATERPAIARWASALGPAHAAVVGP